MSGRGYTAIYNEGPLPLSYRPTGDDYGNPYFNATVSAGVYDITQPNTSAFQNIRGAMLYAAEKRMITYFWPAYIGFAGADPVEGILDALQAATDAQVETYGAYIGSLISDIPGLVIVLGGDDIPNATDLETIRRMVVGIKSTDRAGRIYTWHGARGESSFDVDSVTAGYVASLGVTYVDFAYARESTMSGSLLMTHNQVLNSYAVPHTVFLGEGYYEESPQESADAVLLRRQFWGSWLSGGFGHAFGDYERYLCDPGWQATLSRTGLADDVVNIAAVKARAWWKLAPSTGVGLVTSGGGTVNTLTYKPRAIASDGSWGAVHAPDGTTFTVDMSLFSGTVTARWLNTNGSLVSASGGPTFPNSGTHVFVASSEVGSNARGQADWPLLLEVL